MFSQGQEEVKLEWMYKGPHSSVDREEYLLGRSIDKTLEHINAEEKQQQLGVQQPKNHVEHECIPPSIRDYKLQASEQVDLTAKLQEDPLIAIKKREEENRRQFLNNPVQIKKLQKALKSQKSKKKKHKQQFNSDSDDDLDAKLVKKLKVLKENPGAIKYNKKSGKKAKEDSNLDTILMHKYNELKNKLSDDDLRDILQGKACDSKSSDSSEDEKDSDASRNRSKSCSSSDNETNKKGREHTLSRNKQGKSMGRSYEPEIKKKYNKQNRPRDDDKQKHNNDREKLKQDNRNYYDRNRSTDRERHSQENRNYSRDRRSRSRSGSNERKKYRGTRENYDRNRIKQSTSIDRQRDWQETGNYNRNRRSRSRSDSKETKKYRRAAEQNYKNDKEKYNTKAKHQFDYNAKDYNRNAGEKLEKHRQSSNSSRRRRDSSSSPEEADYKSRQKRRDYKSTTTNISKKDESSNEEEISDKKNLKSKAISKESRNKQMHSDSSDSDTPQKNRPSSSSSEDSDGNPKAKIKNWGLVRADGTKLLSSSKHVGGKTVNTPVDRKVQETKAPNFQKRTKLTEEEKEKRRKEMMANAAWRDLERAKHLKHHRETELKEDQMQKQYDPEFIQKQLIKSANNSTVESRIKANINNIQRSGSDMNKHFSKR